MKKRFLSMLIVFAMIVCVIPAVMADGGTQVNFDPYTKTRFVDYASVENLTSETGINVHDKIEEGAYLGSIWKKSVICFKNMNFTDVAAKTLTIRYARPNVDIDHGILYVRKGSADGPIIAKLVSGQTKNDVSYTVDNIEGATGLLPPTGNWVAFKEETVTLNEGVAVGTFDLYFTFENHGAGNLASFRFDNGFTEPKSLTTLLNTSNIDEVGGGATLDGEMIGGFGNQGAYAKWKDVDFGDVEKLLQFELYYGVAATHAGCAVEIRIDAPDGEIIGRGRMTEGKNWNSTTTYFTENLFRGITGIHDVYVRVQSHPDMVKSLGGNIRSLQFKAVAEGTTYLTSNQHWHDFYQSIAMVTPARGAKNVMLVTAVYDDAGKLLSIKADTKDIKETGVTAFETITLKQTLNVITTGYKVVTYLWNGEILAPINKQVLITGVEAPVEEETEELEPQLRPLSITGGFYDNSENIIYSIEGQTTIVAKAKLDASVAPENLTAYLKLVRSDEEIFSDDSGISFNENGIAEISITFENTNAVAGDVLVFEINDGQSVYYKKQIGYEEASKTVDVLLIAGQSNAMGQYADATASIRPEPDTVYFKTMGNNHLSTNGEIGWAGSLGKTWHEETGHTVLIVKAAWGGTGFAKNPYGYWNADYEGGSQRDCYDEAKSLYQAAIESVKANADYKLGNCVYFWLQGELERDKEYTVEQYSEPFLKMHNGFLNDFGSGDAELTCGGILPIRAKESEGYPANLGFAGPRIAHYSLAASRDDLQIVSDATEHWYSDEAVKRWFKNEYRNREYEGDIMPITMAEVLNTDKLHYRQEAHNELGRQAALSMLAYLNGGTRADGINLITPTGLVHYEDGADIYLTEEAVMPVIDPLSGKKATFTLMDDRAAVMDEYGMITPKEALLNDYTVLNVSVPGQPDMTFKLYSPLTDNSISIAPVKDNKKAAYTFVSDDGLYSSVSFFNEEFKRLGLRGTVAMVTDWIETPGIGEGWDYGTWDKWRELIGEGYFTIANHTRSHPSFSGVATSVYEYQINTALEKLNEEFPDQKVLGVCAPGNYVNDDVTLVTKQRHLSLRRGSHYNDLPVTEESIYRVGFKTVTGSTTTIDEMNGWVDSAISENKWLMEMWHGVGGEGWMPPSKDMATAHFEYIAEKKDDIWVADWNEMIVYSLQRLKSRITIVSKTEDELVIQITDTLDDSIYDAELTVNVTLPEGWSSATAKINGEQSDATVKDGILSVTVQTGSDSIILERI